MPNDPPAKDVTKSLRTQISTFLNERAAPKLEKIEKELAGEEDPEKLDALEQKRNTLLTSYSVGFWLESAAQRGGSQIRTVTHAVKFSNPFARATSLNVKRRPLASTPGFLSTSCIAGSLKEDVVGNAAALDVHKFLQLELDGRTILDRVLVQDPALAAAFSDSSEQAEALMDAFSKIVQIKGAPATDSLLTQLYFPLMDGGYHLLAPLYPTSLVHEVQNQMKECLFSDTAKEARLAQREGRSHPEGYRDFWDLAELQFGGSKPQNISQLNSERGGQAWLLPSFPPTWKTHSMKPPREKSIFDRDFVQRPRVRFLLRSLADFLVATDYNNRHIRCCRASFVDSLTDELWQYASELGELAPGWSAAEDCRLDQEEALWLDPGRAQQDPEFAQALALGTWREEVAKRFGRWLNKQLREKSKKKKELPMGDAEFLQWGRDVKDVIKQLEKELAYDRID